MTFYADLRRIIYRYMLKIDYSYPQGEASKKSENGPKHFFVLF